jgi:hypothetical protein
MEVAVVVLLLWRRSVLAKLSLTQHQVVGAEDKSV